MTTSRLTPIAHARRVLFVMGEELAGERLTRFAADLLAAADAAPREEPQTLAEILIKTLEDGPIALAAAEPWIAHRMLPRPATCASDASLTAVTEFALELLERHRAGEFDALWQAPSLDK